jgi:hypothetical protein
MSFDFTEMAIQLAVIALGYVIGGGVLMLILRMMGLPLGFSHATMLVLTLPLVATLLLEMFTGLWRHTPGSLGFGGFVVFVPMLIAGAATAVAATGAQRLMVPFDPSMPRGSGSELSGWLLLAFVCSGLSLALWRYWPAPTARLW